MSKLDIRISYKDACILKHALRNQCKAVEEEFEYQGTATDKERKELEEEKRTLERFTEQIDDCGFKHNRNIF